MIVDYTVYDNVENQSVYTEMLNSNTYELVEMQQADDVPDGAVSYEAVFNFLAVAQGNSYIVKMSALDTKDNITSHDECVDTVDTIVPTINLFTTTSHVHGHISVDDNVADDSGGGVFCSASL